MVDCLDYRQEMKRLIDDGVVREIFDATELVARLQGQATAWRYWLTRLDQEGFAFTVCDDAGCARRRLWRPLA